MQQADGVGAGHVQQMVEQMREADGVDTATKKPLGIASANLDPRCAAAGCNAQLVWGCQQCKQVACCPRACQRRGWKKGSH